MRIAPWLYPPTHPPSLTRRPSDSPKSPVSAIAMTAEEVAKEKDGEKMLKRDAALTALEESSDEEEEEGEEEEEEENEEENVDREGPAAAVGMGLGAMAGDGEGASVEVTVEGRNLTVVRRRDGSYFARASDDPGAELAVISLHGGSLYVGLGECTGVGT